MAAAYEANLALVAGGLGFVLATLGAFLAGRLGTRLDALAAMALLAFVVLVFGFLSAGSVDGSATVWDWGAAAAYVWLPAAAGILGGGIAGWRLGVRRGG